MIFKCLKRMIERGNYESKEAMAEKITIIYANDQLTHEQYEELNEHYSSINEDPEHIHYNYKKFEIQ